MEEEDYDPEILAEFVAEAEEELSAAEAALMELESSPDDATQIGTLFRHLHTVKSSSGYFSFEPLTQLAHDLEHLLDDLRSGQCKVSGEVTSILLAGLDALCKMVARVKNSEPAVQDIVAYGELIARIKTARVRANDIRENCRLIARSLDRIAPDLPEKGPVAIEFATARELLGRVLLGEGSGAESRLRGAASPGGSDAVGQPVDPESSSTRDKTIRVPESRLEQFLEHVGNMVRLRHVIMSVERRLSSTLDDTLVMHQVRDMTTTFVKESEHLQSSIMVLRKVPVSTVLSKLPRVVRDIAQSLSKEITVELHGQDTEIDKGLIEILEGPLMHMLRNSADHGIETPEERTAAGKAPSGKIEVCVEDGVDKLCVIVRDDGKGINAQRLYDKAVANGVIVPGTHLDEEESLQLMFAAGLSTAESVTEVSGRGVGMDVVRRRIEEQGGEIQVSTKLGEGTEFRLLLPKAVNTAITAALTVCVRKDCWAAIPMKRVAEIVAVDAGFRHSIERLPGGRILRLRQEVIPLIEADVALQIADEPLKKNFAIIIAEIESGRVGLCVQLVEDVMDVVAQRVDYLGRYGTLFSEACLFGDGKIAMMLDVESLAQYVGVGGQSRVRSLQGRSTIKAGTDLSETYLLFEGVEGRLQALPMAAVHRLEMVARTRIQPVGRSLTMQYDGQIVEVHSQTSAASEQRLLLPLVMLRYGPFLAALEVDKIVDVTHDSVEMRHPSRKLGVEEVIVLRGRVVELVDVAQFFSAAEREQCEAQRHSEAA